RSRSTRVHDLDTAPKPRGVGGPDRVCVEARGAADAARPCAAVAEVNGDAIVRMTDDREKRAPDRPCAISQLDDVAPDLAVLAAGECGRDTALQPRGRRRADEDRVVPRQLRDRLRQLLEPTVVCKAAVEH